MFFKKKHSFFERVHLDYIYADSLMQIALKDGWIKKDFFGNKLDVKDCLYVARRNCLRNKTMRLITLFETVNDQSSFFDSSKLVDEGIIDYTLHADDKIIQQRNEESAMSCMTQAFVPRVDPFALESAKTLLKCFRSEFINFSLKRKLLIHWDENAPQTNAEYTKFEQKFDCLVDNIPNDYSYKELESFGGIGSELWLSVCHLQRCIEMSGIEGSSFVTGLSEFQRPNTLNVPKIVDDLYYLVRTKLNDEILILPEPRSLAEAVEIRNSNHMKRFREILSYWLMAMQKGDINGEMKIRKDIKKANKELSRIKRWRKYEKSPINFWFNSIGGHIPFFSNILTVVNTIGGLYSRQGEHVHGWIMLCQGNHER